jgi:hypothetical protein
LALPCLSGSKYKVLIKTGRPVDSLEWETHREANVGSSCHPLQWKGTWPAIRRWWGVCSTYLRLNTSTKCLKLFYVHKPTANSGVNRFYNKCSYKHYLQLL